MYLNKYHWEGEEGTELKFRFPVFRGHPEAAGYAICVQTDGMFITRARYLSILMARRATMKSFLVIHQDCTRGMQATNNRFSSPSNPGIQIAARFPEILRSSLFSSSFPPK